MRRLLLVLAVLLVLGAAAWLALDTRDAVSVAAPGGATSDAPARDPLALAQPADEVPREAIPAAEAAPVYEPPPQEEERYVLDVFDRARPDVRIPRVTVQLEPRAGADAVGIARVTREKHSSPGGGVRLAIEHEDGSSLWMLQDVAVPVTLPVKGGWRPLRVQAEGYREALVEHVAGTGVHRVELGPARSLHVSLLEPPEPYARYLVHVAGPGLADVFERIQAPGECLVPCEDADAITLRVAALPRLGRGPLLLEQEVLLEPAGRTSVPVDLSRIGPVMAGALELTLAADAPDEDMGRWRVELRSVEESNEELLAETASSAVGTWRTLAPQQEYSERFDGIRPGDYEVVVTPIGLRQAVRIERDRVASATIRVPVLSVLTVLPVDGAGVPLGETRWHLYWKLDDETSDGPGEVTGNDVAMGRATAAVPAADRWVITAPFGRRVLVHLLGPKAVGAEPLRVLLDLPAITIDLPLRNL